MKNVVRITSFLIALLLFVSCPLSVYASEHGGGGGSDHQSAPIMDKAKVKEFINSHFTDVMDFWLYAAMQVGAVFVNKMDFETFINNYQAWDDYADDLGVYEDSSGNATGLYLSKEFMAQLKELLDQYAEENQPYFVKSTRKANTIPASAFTSKTAYNEFINYSKSHYMFFFRKNGNGFYVYDFTPEFKEGGGFYNAWKYPAATCNRILAVDSDWNTWDSKKWYYDYYEFNKNADGDMVLDTVHEKYSYYTSNAAGIDITPDRTDFAPAYTNSNFVFLVTQDGGNIRIYQSIADLQNYSVGQRKVYYTSNYYDYVPEDLTVSIDELQKTIEDMQDIIDKLLDQITDNTSENEIEELLRQILEELRNNPGSGSGSGSGGGDINVDIDLSTTNSWLSKIYTKVSNIFDTLSGGSVLQEGLDTILSKLEDLNAMLKKYLSEITGDLDDIKGQLANMSEQEFNEKSDSFLGETVDSFSEISEVAKTKFPFSIPNDLHIFLAKISPPADEEPETETYSAVTAGISLYSGEYVGSGISDEETSSYGGGGASRPGSGFIDVEHGGGGTSREPVGIENNAPVFRLPIVIERYGIEEYIIIDMSPFNPISRFGRTFFTAMFMVCLFNLTFKVIGMWGDIIG